MRNISISEENEERNIILMQFFYIEVDVSFSIIRSPFLPILCFFGIEFCDYSRMRGVKNICFTCVMRTRGSLIIEIITY